MPLSSQPRMKTGKLTFGYGEGAGERTEAGIFLEPAGPVWEFGADV